MAFGRGANLFQGPAATNPGRRSESPQRSAIRLTGGTVGRGGDDAAVEAQLQAESAAGKTFAMGESSKDVLS